MIMATLIARMRISVSFNVQSASGTSLMKARFPGALFVDLALDRDRFLTRWAGACDRARQLRAVRREIHDDRIGPADSNGFGRPLTIDR